MNNSVNLALNDLIKKEDAINRLITSAFINNSFICPVKVVSVNIGAMTVNAKPLVLGVSVDGEAVDNSIIYNLKYIRIQSGSSAIIIDPSIGDIGLVLVCDNDIEKVKVTKDYAMPSTCRMHSLSDSVYLGGFLNQEPRQYIKFTEDGIEIYSPKQIKATAPTVVVEANNLTANVSVSTNIVSGESISLTAPQIALNGAITASQIHLNWLTSHIED
jgi:hypothetical protein